jgi:endonuclease/exonuclease/phosphatase (EEP) superfamily protein YafD
MDQPSPSDRKKKIAAALLKILRVVLGLSLLLLVGLTVTSFVGRLRLLELTSHFRLYYLIAAAVGVAVAITLRTKALIAIAVLVALVNLLPVVPYYRTPVTRLPGPTQPLKLLLANVMHDNSRYDELRSLVTREDPDVLVLQEYTTAWETATAEVRSKYPFSLAAPKPGGAGLALFSRYPLNEARVVDFDISQHDGIFASININGTVVSLVTIHPLTPMRADKFASRNHQLAETAGLLAATTGPKILLGDLNTTIWSPYYRDLVRDSGMRDARLGFGVLGSWPSPLPGFLRLPIDNCLVSSEVRVDGIRTGPIIGSDHLPVIVEVSVSQVGERK